MATLKGNSKQLNIKASWGSVVVGYTVTMSPVAYKSFVKSVNGFSSCSCESVYWNFSGPDLSFFFCIFVFLPEGFATASQEQQVSVIFVHSSLPPSFPLLSGERPGPSVKKTQRDAAEHDLHVVL